MLGTDQRNAELIAPTRFRADLIVTVDGEDRGRRPEAGLLPPKMRDAGDAVGREARARFGAAMRVRPGPVSSHRGGRKRAGYNAATGSPLVSGADVPGRNRSAEMIEPAPRIAADHQKAVV